MSPTRGGRHFHEELARLKHLLLDMSGLAEELVAQAVQARTERDQALAESVIARDQELDGMEVAVGDACLHLLALQQPMARDLRQITTAMSISRDLERVGDHAVNIAQGVQHQASHLVSMELAEIDEMSRISREMLSDAIDAFVRSDPDSARSVLQRDDRVDQLHDSTFRILVTHMMEDPRRISAAMSLLLVSRNLERIADLATNISEDVVFLVEGRNIKHVRTLQALRESGEA